MSKRKATTAPVGVLGVLKEVRSLERAGFIVDVNEANAKSWHIALEPSVLKPHGLGTFIGELKLWARTVRKPVAVVLEVRFAEQHPFEPPFVRVVRPRFVARTGHVTVGGSICTKLLTTDGWRSDLSCEALLHSILENMNDGGAKIDMVCGVDYSLAEALAAFKRVATDHGWTSRVAAR
jgi:ubiquitin-conjugating enzyme E2 Q